jgi:hypothetical protein
VGRFNKYIATPFGEFRKVCLCGVPFAIRKKGSIGVGVKAHTKRLILTMSAEEEKGPDACGKRSTSHDDDDETAAAKRARPELLCIGPVWKMQPVTDKEVVEAITQLVEKTDFSDPPKFPFKVTFTRKDVMETLSGANPEPLSTVRIQAAILSVPPTHWRLSAVTVRQDGDDEFVLVNVHSEQSERLAGEFCQQQGFPVPAPKPIIIEDDDDSNSDT